MKKYYFLLLCFLTFSLLSAQEKLSKEEQARREKNIQAGNPFAKFGYKAKVATLSKGKYLEVHDLDSIVTIGSIRYHVDRKQIVGNIVIDTTDMYARPIGDTPSRWLSPDPLSEEFPDWSPYAFVNNNPLSYNDPTGMAPESVIPPDDYQVAKDGKVTKIKETNDNFDRLYNSDKSKNITIDKGLLTDRFTNKDVSYFIGTNTEDAKKTYNFLADNSDVEYSLAIFTNKKDVSVISTTFDKDKQTNGDFYTSILKNKPNLSLTYHSHSHPGKYDPADGWPAYPSGFKNDLSPDFKNSGDRNFYNELRKQFPNRIPKLFDIYVPSSPKTEVKYNHFNVIRN